MDLPLRCVSVIINKGALIDVYINFATHPITLERKGAHAIGRSMGWTESWTLSDN